MGGPKGAGWNEVMPCRRGPRWGPALGPLGPRKLAGEGTQCEDREASGILLLPAQSPLAFHAHFFEPLPGVSPSAELPGASPRFRGRGPPLLGCPVQQQARPSCASSRAPRLPAQAGRHHA